MKRKNKFNKIGKRVLALSLVTTLTVGHTVAPIFAQETDENGSVQAIESSQYTLEERFDLSVKLGVSEYMEEDGYLSDEYAHPLSFDEMSSGIRPLIRISDFDEIITNEEIYRIYPNMEDVINGQSIEEMPTSFSLIDTYDISTYSSNYIATYDVISHSNGLTIGAKFTAYTPAGLIDVFCGDHGTASPTVGDVLTSITEVSDTNVLKALYYGYGGPGAIGGKSSDLYLETANAASYYLDSSNNGYASTAYRTMLESKATVPNGFKVYTTKTNGGSTQDILFSVYEPEGYVTLTKSSSNTSVTGGSSCYSLEGAEYRIYSDKACTSSTGNTLITNSTGVANTATLDAGTYYVKEIKAPLGYQQDLEVYTVTVTAGGTSNLSVTDDPYYDPVGMVLTKVDADTGTATTTGAGELEGAQFTLKFYNTQGNTNGLNPTRTWVFETDINGYIGYEEKYKISGDALFYDDGMPILPLGTITIQETQAPTGYQLDSTIYTRVIELDTALDTVRVDNVPEVQEKIIRGGVKIQKFDNETSMSTSQGGATFNGTTYEIVNNTGEMVYVDGKAYNDGTVVKTLVADSGGYVETLNDLLPYGDYAIREIKAPVGYLLEGVLNQTFTITTNGQMIDMTSAITSIRDDVIRGGVKIAKYDIELDTNKSQSGATLEGAVFHIINANNASVVVNGTTYRSGEVVMSIKTNEEGIATTGYRDLPYGNYRILESEEPTGYLSEGILTRDFTISQQGVIVDMTGQSEAIKNYVIRGDLALTKITDSFMTRMVGVPFKITSVDTGESITIITDDNGYASTSSSWNKHSSNTNGGDSYEDGVWIGPIETIDESRGALPYGYYEVEELECEANEGMVITPPFTVRIYKDGYTVDLETITNDYITVPCISTNAYDYHTDTREGAFSYETMLNDTVTYYDASIGQTYTLVGTLMSRTTKEPIIVNGEEVHSTTTFIADKVRGTVDVEFVFDGTGLDAGDIVVFEKLYSKDGVELSSHEEIRDNLQTVNYVHPSITTTAVDKDTWEKEGVLTSETTITDRVLYEGMVPGREYTVIGLLMDKSTGEPVLVNGEIVTGNQVFQPEEMSGYVDIEFLFDGTSLGDIEIVVFERVIDAMGNVVATHEDIEDENQTVRYEKIEEIIGEVLGVKKEEVESVVVMTDEIVKDNPTTGDKTRLDKLFILLIISGSYIWYRRRKVLR